MNNVVLNIGIVSRILSYAKIHKNSYMLLSIGFTLLISLISSIRPFIIKFSLDKYVKDNIGRPNGELLNQVIISLVIISFISFIAFQIILLFIETMIRYMLAINMAKISLEILTKLRNDIYTKILNLKLSTFDKMPIGAFTTRTINDVEAMNQIFSDGLVPMIADILSIALIIITMFWVDWQLSLLTLVTLPLTIIASYLFKYSVKKSFQKVRVAVSKLNSFIQEHLNNREILQIFSAEKQEFTKFTEINNLHKEANIKAISAYAIFYPIIEIIAAIGIMLLLLFSFHFQVDAPKVIFYFLVINQIFRPLRFIADRINTLQMGVISAKRIFSILDSQDTINQDKKSIPLLHSKEIHGEITFKQVSFSYNQDKIAINNISLHIPAKSKVAFVGYSGQGKTTIINLINRLYQHEQGQILLDGIPVENFNIYDLRRQIAIIPQNVFLFSGPLYKNISLGNENISLEQIQDACKLLGIHQNIMRLSGAYEHIIEERSINFSVGEKQLICMARALVWGSKILILDEATSNMDTHTEELVENALKVLGQKYTIILIAHRLSSVCQADQIFFIEQGQIAEQGTHTELLAKHGKYYNMLKKQPNFCKIF